MENEFSEEDEEGEEDIELDECASAFSILENEYRIILPKIQELDGLEDLADAYTKLFDAHYQTYTNEQELITKTTDQDEKLSEANQIIEQLKANAELQATAMETLENQLAYSKLLTDESHSREQQSQEVIENMRAQILKLNNELELKSRLGGDEQEEELGAANKTQEGFEREKQRMIDEITGLKQKLKNALSYSEELEHKNSAADLKTNELNNMLEQHMAEGSKKQRTIEKLESDILQLNRDIETIHVNLDESRESLELANKQIAQLEFQLKGQKTATDKAIKNGEMIQLKLEKCEMELETASLELSELKEKFTTLSKACKVKTEECNQLRSEVGKITKHKDNIEKKLVAAERIKSVLEQEINKIKTNLNVLERELFIANKKAHSDKRTIDVLIKEKEVISKNLLRVQGTVEGHVKLIKIQEQSKRKLEIDIITLREEINGLKKLINKLEKDKNKIMSEALDLTQQVEDAMDEIKMKQQTIYENKKLIAELETKLRQQQNIFEAVRADRNAFQKQVLEVTSELAELRSKFKVSIHQNQQFKEDILGKESLLIKEENILRKVNKEKENLKIEVQNCMKTISNLKHEIEELNENATSLRGFIQEHEKRIKVLDKECQQITNDRDVIGAQLVRKNDEIGLLSQKLNILEDTLARGETQFEQRLDDIKLLKLEVRRIRQERDFLSKSIANMTDLKHEVFTLERELAQERLKCRALEEELQHPMNIHRWRKLEGSDPHVVDLLKKIQILQKRLLNQTSESIEREKQLKESEKLYLSLRQMLSRLPGPDVQSTLTKTQHALTLRGTKMKCLISELNMCETKAMEYKMDVDKISKELKETKKKYFKQKKIVETQLTSQTKLPAIKSNEDGSQTKVTGGGFKMSQ